MKNIITVILIMAGVRLSAQEVNLPTYLNHMMDNPFLISPSYAGIGSSFQMRANSVMQWEGVKYAPSTQSIVLETRLKEQLGGGLTVFNDKNGFTKQLGGKVSMAYHLMLSNVNSTFLSFSLGANYTQFTLETDKFDSPDEEILPTINENYTNFDFSVLYRLKRWAISFNAKNILDKEIKNISSDEPSKLRHFALFNVYTHKINPYYEFEPSLYVEFFESDGRSHSDLNLKIRKKIRDGYVWAGASYSVVNDQAFASNTLTPTFGIKKLNFYVAYGVSFMLNKVAEFNYGSHMITLGIDYNRKPSLSRCTQNVGMF